MNKFKEIFKKYGLIIIDVLCWLLGIALGSTSKFEAEGGLFIGAAIILLIIIIAIAVKKNKKKKSAPVNSAYSSPIALPDAFSEDGRRYDLKYQYSGVEIVGRQYYSGTQLIMNEPLYLMQEPTNQYDAEAVSVNVMRGGVLATVGYIAQSSNIKTMVNDFYSRNEKVLAYVDDNVNETMIIGFYK